jgi:4-amino-4-deoxy-L-arabinose transferase-like glycosyltransferase
MFPVANPPFRQRNAKMKRRLPPNAPLQPASGSRWWLAILVVWLAFGLLRSLALPDFVDEDHQERQAAYTLDLLRNGHWFAQEDQVGRLAGKPPLYTWLSAAAALPTGGRLTELALYAPALLATLATMLLLWQWGRRAFGEWEGRLASLLFLLSPFGLRSLHQARIDGLFAACVLAAAYAAYLAWERRRGWLWFWLAAAVATLAKGPLGLALGAMGLLAAPFAPRHEPGTPAPAQPSPVREHLLGLLLFLGIGGGWFLLGWQEAGPRFWDRLVIQELVSHAVGGQERQAAPGLAFWFKPAGYILSRMLPWSLPAALALWRLWIRPDPSPERRRAGRFLAAFFLGSLLLFSLATHRRPDLMLPLAPPLALLAAVEVARWWRPASPRQAAALLGVPALALLVAMAYYFGPLWRQDRAVMRTAGTLEVHRQLRALETAWAKAGEPPELIITSRAAVGLQIMENTLVRQPPPEKAAQWLRTAKRPLLIVTGVGTNDDLDDGKLLRAALPPGTPLHEVIPWPKGIPGFDPRHWGKTGANFLRVFSNLPPPALAPAAGKTPERTRSNGTAP